MTIRVIDFETYYDQNYSLSKLQTDEYIFDPRFEIILVAVDGEWFSGTHEEIKIWLAGHIDFDNDTLVAHHAAFDGFILTQVLGLAPAKWVDTLSMSRAVLPYLKSHSLASLAKHYKLPDKGVEVHNMRGRTRTSLQLGELLQYACYCLHDVELTRAIYNELAPLLGAQEMALIDMTIRMFTEPKIQLDYDKLLDCYNSEVSRKATLLDKAGIAKADLMSNQKFAAVLSDYGVSPPTKISPTTGKETYAFAKSDKEFTALLEHEDSEVQTLVAARLGVKSTIAETRALKLLNTSQRGDGKFPVMLNYWGAKTTGRYSGGNGINAQNIPARGPGSELRKAMVAPPGYLLVVGDSSNIELRVAMACAGQTDAIDKLRAGVDLYCDFASAIHGREITKEDKPERFLGKVAMLSLQYGAGPTKFQEIVRLLAKQTIRQEEATYIVDLYRNVYSKVSALWRHCNFDILPAIYNRDILKPVDVNNWFLTVPDGFSHIGLPGVIYHNLRKDTFDTWVYGDGIKLYGGKVVENLCQHMARHVVMWQTAAINVEYPVALSVHDEIMCVVKKAEADKCADYMTKVLSTAPSWCRAKLPVNCEVHIGYSYGEAKG